MYNTIEVKIYESLQTENVEAACGPCYPRVVDGG